MKDGAFYYVIPAKVMHDVNLEFSHKCIYGQIAGLSKREGHCWATNSYLAEMNGVSERQIQRILQALSKAGHIRIELDPKRDRKIYLGTTCVSGGTTCVSGGTTCASCEGTTSMSGGCDTDVVPYKEDEQVNKTTEGLIGTHPEPEDETDRVEPATDGYILACALLKFIRNTKKHYGKIARFFSPEKQEESLRRWAKDIDLLLTRDAKEYEEAVMVLKWCQKDEFWQGQILSGNNFRKHYDNLKLQMNGVGGVKSADQDITDSLIKAYCYLCNNKSWKPRRHQLEKFVSATDRVIAFIDKHQGCAAPTELVTYLRDCLQETFREKGEVVHPGHLDSDYTWDVLLPQYLENVIGAL